MLTHQNYPTEAAPLYDRLAWFRGKPMTNTAGRYLEANRPTMAEVETRRGLRQDARTTALVRNALFPASR